MKKSKIKKRVCKAASVEVVATGMPKNSYQQGYIAISAAIILSLLMLVVAISLGSSNLFTRFSLIDFNNKQVTFTLANSCLEYAKFKLSEDDMYAGNETINISSDTCTVLDIEVISPNKIIKATSTINGVNTNLRLTVDENDLSTVSLEEVATF